MNRYKLVSFLFFRKDPMIETNFNKQYLFKKYDYQTSLDFWKHLYHDTNYNGYIYFCIKSKNKFENLYHCKLENVSDFLQTLQICKHCDYYYSSNEFRVSKSGVKRDARHLFAFHCCVIDVDCHNAKINEHQLSQNINTYIQKVDAMILDEDIPYNIIVNTGRGIQFLYIYSQAISYKVEFKHKKIQEILIKQHQRIVSDFPELNLSVDAPASKRSSGVYRMPCTYNTKASKTNSVTYSISPYAYLDVDKAIDNNYEEQSTSTIYEIQKQFRDNNKPNIARCKKVINAIYQYQSDERASQNNPGHENRTCSCFILSPFLLALYDYKTALNILTDFNSNYKQPLPHKRLATILDYCLDNYKDDKKCSMRYFKNSTILDYLGIESGEYDIYVTDDYVYNPYYSRISPEERQQRKGEKLNRNTLIKTLLEQGECPNDIATKCNCSLSTIYRFAKKNALSPPRKTNPWEDMGISRATYYRRMKK